MTVYLVYKYICPIYDRIFGNFPGQNYSLYTVYKWLYDIWFWLWPALHMYTPPHTQPHMYAHTQPHMYAHVYTHPHKHTHSTRTCILSAVLAGTDGESPLLAHTHTHNHTTYTHTTTQHTSLYANVSSKPHNTRTCICILPALLNEAGTDGISPLLTNTSTYVCTKPHNTRTCICSRFPLLCVEVSRHRNDGFAHFPSCETFCVLQ